MVAAPCVILATPALRGAGEARLSSPAGRSSSTGTLSRARRGLTRGRAGDTISGGGTGCPLG